MYFVIVILILIVDILTKRRICKKIKEGEKKEIVKNRLYLWHIKNKGAAYNSFEGHMQAVKWISALGILYCVYHICKENKNVGYALLLGGGLGNFLERVKYGEVTDFLYIENHKKSSNIILDKMYQKSRPIFNIADIFVALGAMIIIISAILQKEN